MLLLDTQAWVWWTGENPRLSRTASAAIKIADALAISAVSVMEAAYAARRGRLSLDRPFDEWLNLAISSVDLQIISFDATLAQRAGQLDWSHGDPMDRTIVATALTLGMPIVSSDYHIRECKLIETVW